MGLAADERALLEQSLERFMGEACSLEHRRALLNSDVAFNRDNWSALADMGVLALPFAESDGGLGGSIADVTAVSRVLGAALALEPYLQCVIVAGRLLATTGDEVTRQAWLPKLMAGQALLGLAHLERGDHSLGRVRTTKLAQTASGYRLAGSKLLVPAARELDATIVTARDEEGRLQACLVPSGTPGVDIRSYRTVDGQLAGEVTYTDVLVPDALRLMTGNLEAQLEGVLCYARAAAAADTVGCMRELLRLTIEYCNQRKQFGQPIARFQVLKHRLVDCYTGLQQSEAMLGLTTRESGASWAANVAAAKAFIDEHAIHVGHEAIQMHGAMGLTDELAVSHYHKRVVSNAMIFGDRLSQIDMVVARSAHVEPQAPSSALSFAELLAPEEEAFRKEVREFLDGSLTEELRTVSRRLTCTFPEKEPSIEWQKRLNARGWLAPLWPKEYGGTGWTAVERFIFEYECAIGGAPERTPMGFRYVGPVVAAFGSDWQKSHFLPRLLSSEHYWAQGFSEPGAGSDLAAIKTAAVLDGDHYVVNGTKMWVTNAHHADWIFCLVRTAQTGKPQEGISFLLIDLRSPGIRIEPIRLLAVDHEVNQVFFDDVRVPARNLVGEPGQGWQYAKFLLELERGGSVSCGRVRAEFDAVKELIAGQQPSLLQDKTVARRLAVFEVRLMALELLEFGCARSMTRATDPGVGGSMTKLLSSELHEDITEFGVQVAGLAGLELELVRPIPDPRESDFPGIDLELVAMPRYLNTRATTIFAGSSEIQREIISKHILGFRV